MARDFTKNASNVLDIGATTVNGLVSGATATSIHAWLNYDTVDTDSSTRNRVFQTLINDGNSSGIFLGLNASAGGVVVLKVGGRSVYTDSFASQDGSVDLSSGTWHNVGGVLNYTGDTITPYINGSADGGGAVTFANNTYTVDTNPTDADAIGVMSTN